ncbi:hypothetical protein [Amycolatopsis anabasis]|uniref:hypothetical protein n=1 Tax=Amycolatopsis anabasis TaxID=1840409 RepID=UPI00131E1F62|nr:hypothetical protein [Amycolatopsis anabasis]
MATPSIPYDAPDAACSVSREVTGRVPATPAAGRPGLLGWANFGVSLVRPPRGG